MSANSEEPMPASNLEQGGKDSIVLLHSSASCGTQWRGFKETYRGRYDIVTPDLQGYGDLSTWSGSNAWTLDDEVLLVEAEVAHLPGHFHLVGHSFGGAVALKFAMTYPERIASLTLFEPVAFHLLRQGSLAERALFDEAARVASEISIGLVRGDFWTGMARFIDYWNGTGTWDELGGKKHRRLARCAGKVAMDFWATMNETTPLSAYRTITAPTMILRGAESPAPTRRIAELLRSAMPAARLVTLGDTGHMAPLTNPRSVNRHIAQHIAMMSRAVPPLEARHAA